MDCIIFGARVYHMAELVGVHVEDKSGILCIGCQRSGRVRCDRRSTLAFSISVHVISVMVNRSCPDGQNEMIQTAQQQLLETRTTFCEPATELAL
jgi:hypothetical protein